MSFPGNLESVAITPSQSRSKMILTPAGLAMPGIGYHVQSVVSPPIRSTGPPLGARLRISCPSTGSTPSGPGRSASATVPYSSETPMKPDGKASVLFFITSDCPIANSYAPEIQRICSEYSAKQVSCDLIYVDPTLTVADVKKHVQDFGYSRVPAILDSSQKLVRAAGATTTPEAAIMLWAFTCMPGEEDSKLNVLASCQSSVERDAILNWMRNDDRQARAL